MSFFFKRNAVYLIKYVFGGWSMMEKEFNITGTCIPSENYMVNIDSKLREIKNMIEKKRYFTINRGRQYGKTTTLFMLSNEIKNDYVVIRLTFEHTTNENLFKNEQGFCQGFLEKISKALKVTNYKKAYYESWLNKDVKTFETLGEHITIMCEIDKVVLMIDEVDKASNNLLFLGFLSMLRSKFLLRREGLDCTFHSVILAGVYDIKNIKLKMISEGLHIPTELEGKIHNSPWNIAINFKVDMSFSTQEIKTMLIDYENDYQTGMDISHIAEEIRFYTGGYPVLVSSICKYMDEDLNNWTAAGVREAVRLLVGETENPLFRGLSQNLEGHIEVYQLLHDVLISGVNFPFSTLDPAVDLANRYGYIYKQNDRVIISNKIFEMVMTDYFVIKDMRRLRISSKSSWFSDITRTGKFDMAMCLERFQTHWYELYNEKEGEFLENQCRMIFMTYLRPFLNGNGFYFIESATTDDRRMDLVVTYGNERFIVEMKIWRGDAYNQKGIDQLLGYMDKYNEIKGYLLTFDFRKNPKPLTPQWIQHSTKEIFEVRVSKKI